MAEAVETRRQVTRAGAPRSTRETSRQDNSKKAMDGYFCCQGSGEFYGGRELCPPCQMARRVPGTMHVTAPRLLARRECALGGASGMTPSALCSRTPSRSNHAQLRHLPVVRGLRGARLPRHCVGVGGETSRSRSSPFPKTSALAPQALTTATPSRKVLYQYEEVSRSPTELSQHKSGECVLVPMSLAIS